MPNAFRGYPRRIDARTQKISPAEYKIERGEGNTAALFGLIQSLTVQDVEFYVLCEKQAISGVTANTPTVEQRTSYTVKVADDCGVLAIFRGEMLEVLKGES